MKIRGGRQVLRIGGGGHLRGKLIFGGGGNVEFSKRYCYLPMPLSQNFRPPPFQKGGDIPRNIEYPRNIAPL
jgi:hypothetical protein